MNDRRFEIITRNWRQKSSSEIEKVVKELAFLRETSRSGLKTHQEKVLEQMKNHLNLKEMSFEQ